MLTPQDVNHFWFEEKGPSFWYKKDPAFDAEIRERFGDLHRRASAGELWTFRDTPEGRLAEITLLDQFSRNMFRDTPQAFATDPLALVLAQEAVRAGAHEAMPERRSGFLMPYMHSESKVVHEEALRLFQDTDALEWEIKHKAIIDRFGRYPHRNAILGRQNTPEEEAFLKEPGSSF